MISEVEVVQHVDNIVRSIGIFLSEFVEYANFDEGLVVEALFVSNDFDRDILISFVVQCANHLAETSLSNHLQNLIAIADVIMNHLKGEKRKNEI